MIRYSLDLRREGLLVRVFGYFDTAEDAYKAMDVYNQRDLIPIGYDCYNSSAIYLEVGTFRE